MREYQFTLRFTDEEAEAFEAAYPESRWTETPEEWVRDAIRMRLASSNAEQHLPIHRRDIAENLGVPFGVDLDDEE